MVERAGVEVKLPFKAHPQMLRRACGFALANKGARYPRLVGLLRAQEYSAHRQVHGAIADAVQGFLAELGGGNRKPS